MSHYINILVRAEADSSVDNKLLDEGRLKTLLEEAIRVWVQEQVEDIHAFDGVVEVGLIFKSQEQDDERT